MSTDLIKKANEVKEQYNEILEEIEQVTLSKKEKSSLKTILTSSIVHQTITLDHISS